jgi:hypothetical protein
MRLPRIRVEVEWVAVPRPRFTVRTMMGAVALAAVLLRRPGSDLRPERGVCPRGPGQRLRPEECRLLRAFRGLFC